MSCRPVLLFARQAPARTGFTRGSTQPTHSAAARKTSRCTSLTCFVSLDIPAIPMPFPARIPLEPEMGGREIGHCATARLLQQVRRDAACAVCRLLACPAACELPCAPALRPLAKGPTLRSEAAHRRLPSAQVTLPALTPCCPCCHDALLTVCRRLRIQQPAGAGQRCVHGRTTRADEQGEHSRPRSAAALQGLSSPVT